MSFIRWDDTLLTGVEEIDNQHKKLFDAIVAFHDRLIDAHNNDIVKPVLKMLVEYVHFHFSSEEKRMEACGYPDIDHHKGQHKVFTGNLAGLVKKYQAKNPLVAREILLSLTEWYRRHILCLDKELAKYIKEHPSGD